MRPSPPPPEPPQTVLDRIDQGRTALVADRYLVFNEERYSPHAPPLQSIWCRRCNRHSFNPNDALWRFCVKCDTWHDYPNEEEPETGCETSPSTRKPD